MNKDTTNDPLLNLQAASEYLGGPNERTVREWVRMKELGCVRKPGTRRLYFRLSQLNAFIKRREQPALRRAE